MAFAASVAPINTDFDKAYQRHQKAPVDNCKRDPSTKENDGDDQEFNLLAIMSENCSGRLADRATFSAQVAVEWEHEDKKVPSFTPRRM